MKHRIAKDMADVLGTEPDLKAGLPKMSLKPAVATKLKGMIKKKKPKKADGEY